MAGPCELETVGPHRTVLPCRGLRASTRRRRPHLPVGALGRRGIEIRRSGRPLAYKTPSAAPGARRALAVAGSRRRPGPPADTPARPSRTRPARSVRGPEAPGFRGGPANISGWTSSRSRALARLGLRAKSWSTFSLRRAKAAAGSPAARRCLTARPAPPAWAAYRAAAS